MSLNVQQKTKPFKKLLIDLIHRNGPISLENFMELCLTSKEGGYYLYQHPIGSESDFLTAPEISQMFGEIIGLWFVDQWEQLGCPSSFTFLELGPGKGTLLHDILRSARIRPSFLDAIQIHLVEISPYFRDLQRKILQDFRINWHNSLDEALQNLPHQPVFLLANEFFDVLPIQQFIRKEDGWHERLVDFNPHSQTFCFVDGPLNKTITVDASVGSVLESSPQTLKAIRDIAQTLKKLGGVGIIIDYGYEEPCFGETIQAIANHKHQEVLENPGEHDLSAHVNFHDLKEIFRAYPKFKIEISTQRNFLLRHGIVERTKILMKQKAKHTEEALHRLVGLSEMGGLFKVLTLTPA